MPDTDIGGRTDQEIASHRFSIILGGETIELPVKAILPMADFRAHLEELVSIVTRACGPEIEAAIRHKGTMADLLKTLDTVELLKRVAPVFVGPGLDALVAALWAYDERLAAHRDDATDEEIIDAAVGVLRIAIPPFLAIAQKLSALAGGLSPTCDESASSA